MSQKAGITCDNYKIEKFEDELKENGFAEYTVKPLFTNVSLITIVVEKEQIPQIKSLCERVENHFKSKK